MAGTNSLDQEINLIYPNFDDAQNNSETDYAHGIIYRQQNSSINPGGWEGSQLSPYDAMYSSGRYIVRNPPKILVSYTAGYSSVPPDLALLCNALVADAYHMGLTDRTLQSERLGDYAYQLADRVRLTEEQRAMLSSSGFMKLALGARQ